MYTQLRFCEPGFLSNQSSCLKVTGLLSSQRGVDRVSIVGRTVVVDFRQNFTDGDVLDVVMIMRAAETITEPDAEMHLQHGPKPPRMKASARARKS